VLYKATDDEETKEEEHNVLFACTYIQDHNITDEHSLSHFSKDSLLFLKDSPFDTDIDSAFVFNTYTLTLV